MTDGPPMPGRARRRVPLTLRLALRELREGIGNFGVFLACIVLGSATIAAVTSLALGLAESISRESQSLAGADVSVALVHREATAEERDFLATVGRVSVVQTMRAMLRTAADRRLVEVKGVDASYPLFGALTLASGRSLQDVLASPAGVAPVVVDPSLLATTGLTVGDEAELGRLRVKIVDVIESEPDRLAGGIAFGPRVLLRTDALADAGLAGPGSLVRWTYRLTGADRPMAEGDIARFRDEVSLRFPTAGWRVESRDEVAPSLRESIGRFAQFLTLVGLTALTVGGVGVSNAVRAYLARRRRSIAALRLLGASPRFVVAVYLQQIALVALTGVLVGTALGAAVPPIAATFLRGILPVSALTDIYPGALGLTLVYGMLTALTFSLPGLAEAHAVRPIELVRGDDAPPPSRRFLLAAGLSGLLLAVCAVAGAFDRWVAAVFVLGVCAVFLLLRGVSGLVMRGARSLPRPRRVIVRLAIANLHRRGALTLPVTLALGISLTLFATLSLVDANLREALTERLPAQAPSFFFVDVQSTERDAFVAALHKAAPDGKVETEPMLRGRIVAINDVEAADWPEGPASWVLRGDRGITYAAAPPVGSAVVAGAWWTDDVVRNEVSFAADLAAELGVGVGDKVRVNVLGREIEATIANLRTVDWESLGINFVMMFSPNVFKGAPHADLATLTLPPDADVARELEILRSITDAFPTVTAVRVKEALETVNGIVSDLVLAVRAAASVTLVTSMFVLAGTLASSHRERVYDAVVLKMLGARRRTVVGAYALEYALLGACCGVFALVSGTMAAWGIVTGAMELPFTLFPASAMATVAVGIAITVGLGLVGTWRALGKKPAQVLRHL